MKMTTIKLSTFSLAFRKLKAPVKIIRYFFKQGGISFLVALIPFSIGLKCWMTPDGKFMNKLDFTKIIEEKECGDAEKSCNSEMYNVGRMWCTYLKHVLNKYTRRI